MPPPKDPFVEIRGWQKKLKARLYYLPWDEDAPWFQHPDPQVAWTSCDDASALLWILGRTIGPGEWDARRELARHLYHVAHAHRPAQTSPEIDALDDALFELFDGVKHGGDTRDVRLADRDVNRVFPDDNIFEIEHGNATYFYARCLSDVVSVYVGVPERAHYVGYYLGKLGMSEAKLALILRSAFSIERFTQ